MVRTCSISFLGRNRKGEKQENGHFFFFRKKYTAITHPNAPFAARFFPAERFAEGLQIRSCF